MDTIKEGRAGLHGNAIGFSICSNATKATDRKTSGQAEVLLAAYFTENTITVSNVSA